ncbi:hypothetical protein L1987_81102 [Smallanthus sonchifolius]|uniref:Uncharacterized protein n=1 Tax=Smallanthus sonchifolius TaxID=185202 RepID=A0ACB8YQ87_9ASTR|nr:hypothetical protein L1987_81102 [Smallanthus sonchifolius]
MMKVSSSAFAASVLAASTAALSSSQSNSSVQELGGRKGGEISLAKEKFAPRFDGLKFIETLVTAHR